MSKYKNIVILTGAGISAESGIKTFRDHNGLWENHRVEDVASYEGFLRNPTLVHEFYNQRRLQLQQGPVPNQAHIELAKFEQQHVGDFFLITQNVDDLHQRAGSKNILPMHGELLKARCQQRGDVLAWADNTTVDMPCPVCQRQGCLRPHIVWFGEIPLEMNLIQQKLQACDLFIAIGTSAMVYPAAQFIQWVRREGRAYTIEVNLEETPASDYFHQTVLGKAHIELAKLLPSLV
jgi:NAD-dependent deacetylase